MRVVLACIGRQKSGAERELAERYFERARLAGRGAGLNLEFRELSEGRARGAPERKREEAAALRALAVGGGACILFDETGEALDSRAFAQRIGRLRDEGCGHLLLAVGGADGLDPTLRGEAQGLVAFGAMTWPHQLVRVMACEQIYRATTLLTGHPYHRD